MFEWKVPFFVFAALSCSVLANCPSEPVKECFSQSEFDRAFAEAKTQLESMEKMLRDNANITGFAMTKDDPAFLHFSTHNISAEIYEANRISQIRTIALKILKSRGGYSTNQFKLCLKTTKIDTSQFCPRVTVDCSFDDTR